ncbi:MAG: EAL domain-containing protein [Gammaproteobacteria bacterium]
MLQIDNSFLRSKFARRIFLLFVLSAVIPVVAVALLSFSHISTQFSKQSYEQSRIVCKAIGMELYRRLTMAHDELLALGKNLRGAASRQEMAAAGLARNLAPDFQDITYISGTGTAFHLRGKRDQLPMPDQVQRQRLSQGKTIIQTQYDLEGRRDILLIQAVNKPGPAGGMLIGTVDPDFIWAVNDLLPTANDLLVLNPDGMILYSSRPSLRSMLPQLMPLLTRSISDHFDWRFDGENNQASFWSVFTQDLFSSPNLVLVVSEPESIALTPIKNFTTIYIPLLLLTILGISFVAAKQIRSKLLPLVTLQKATQRIASGDFSGRINISTDDEFSELGSAFNVMAGHLDSQFTSLTTLAEIDRMILSSFDARFIVSTVLGHAGDLAPCTLAAVLELDEGGSGDGKLSIRHTAPESAIEEHRVRLSHDEIRNLQQNLSCLQYDTGANYPGYLEALSESVTRIVLFPTLIKGRLSSVLLFGFSGETPLSEEAQNSLRKFADHVAVALSNASWEERLYHQAHYDPLTNLPNRALLKDRLEQAIARAQRNLSRVGLLFLDLDRFKLVNDSLGHAEGDAILKKMANILTGQIRSVDTVVRFGGDEFIIIIPDIDGRDDAALTLGGIAEKIFQATQSGFETDRQIVHPKMSIGIALYPKDGQSPEELIKNADAAMYHAKGKGRARYEFFAPDLNAAASYRLQLEGDLRRAIGQDEFFLTYQPKVDCNSGRLIGAEALIRWRHPTRGMVSPMEFITIAEETGMILEIGEWVIRTACQQIAAWDAAGLNPAPIAVNVSPRQFQEDNFTAIVTKVLGETGLQTRMLQLEITETTVMVDAEQSIAKLKACRDSGLHISMDDFGTGYSSLSYLRKLPIHSLKIDQSFIAAISEDDHTHAIVGATIILAHKLGLKVIAEGVETEQHRQMLQQLHCDILQGYLISKPLTAEQFTERFLKTGAESHAADTSGLHRLRNAAK